jgi:hypothetical protein
VTKLCLFPTANPWLLIIRKGGVFFYALNPINPERLCIKMLEFKDVLDTNPPVKMKTYADWKGDLHDYLQLGDSVDDEIFQHFLNVLPPAYWSDRVLQIGEPYSHIDGKPIYPTLCKGINNWVYAGNCFKGHTEQPIEVQEHGSLSGS